MTGWAPFIRRGLYPLLLGGVAACVDDGPGQHDPLGAVLFPLSLQPVMPTSTSARYGMDGPAPRV